MVYSRRRDPRGARSAPRLPSRGRWQIEVTRVAGIEDAGPGDLTFLSNPKYASKLATTRASAVIVDDAATARAVRGAAHARGLSGVCRRRRDAHAAERRPAPGISPLAAIDPTATLGAGRPRRAVRRRSAPTRASARARSLHPHVVIGAGAVDWRRLRRSTPGVSIREGVHDRRSRGASGRRGHRQRRLRLRAPAATAPIGRFRRSAAS